MATDYYVVNLKTIIENEELSKLVIPLLSTFSCSKNHEVENFLKENSIDFTKAKKSITYLVCHSDSKELVGYFTLAVKSIQIKADVISKKTLKRLRRFGKQDLSTGLCTVPAYLIAQLGKNYNIQNDRNICGDDLICLAEQILLSVQAQIGCGFIFLECENKKVLTDFYKRHSYVQYGSRISEDDGIELLQLMKPF